ncbi:hypothetical protein CJ014_00730 [Pleomorphomonas carboxyditropha]|uniref:Uncharacterized protein n=1 Tax=Pleomorphomonas carboxyditropha TaxID=2023338 RepID=A0A2G9X2S4_9HYPH|nr:hypothetical protein CJ014_00730 [Pleomorphomonas carboxyditropha]
MRSTIVSVARHAIDEIAFDAQRELKSEVDRVFDRPVKFTQSAFRVDKAKDNGDGTVSGRVYIQPIQSAYLRREIEGGINRVGDPGSGPHSLIVYSLKRSSAGGVPRRETRRLSDMLRKEMSEREELRRAREVLRSRRLAGEHVTHDEYVAASWPGRHGKKQGLFFGGLGGVLGYWRRPDRRVVKSKRRGSRMSTAAGASKAPELLLQFKRETKPYRPIFRYDRVVIRAGNRLPLEVQKKLRRALQK